MLWAGSLFAQNNSVGLRHAAIPLEAPSEDAAMGLAFKIARKFYPNKDGWYNYHVVVSSVEDAVATVEQASIGKIV